MPVDQNTFGLDPVSEATLSCATASEDGVSMVFALAGSRHLRVWELSSGLAQPNFEVASEGRDFPLVVRLS